MPTLTVIVNLPDDIYRNAISLPVDEREERIIAAFATAPNRQEEPKLSQGDLDAIGEGLKDIAEGRTVSGTEVFDAIEKRYGWKK